MICNQHESSTTGTVTALCTFKSTCHPQIKGLNVQLKTSKFIFVYRQQLIRQLKVYKQCKDNQLQTK